MSTLRESTKPCRRIELAADSDALFGPSPLAEDDDADEDDD